MKKIAVVGASGFIGRHLIAQLMKDKKNQIIALSRSPISEELRNQSNVFWRYCDLHSLKQIEKALEGVTDIYYLVHSMIETVRFRQGDFQDIDLSLADNLGRAARKNEIKRLIYLSGIIPKNVTLSAHLASRLEIEKVLRFYIPKAIALRAGIIFGYEGSSFNIMLLLTKRVPFLLCPVWVKNRCQPIYISDVTKCLEAALHDEKIFGRSLDIGGPEAMSYLNMIYMIANKMGVKRYATVLPLIFPKLSRYWICFITRAPKSLVYPLFDSMREEMVCRNNFHYKKELCLIGIEESIVSALETSKSIKKSLPLAFLKRYPKNEKIRSIQRIQLPSNLDAKEIASLYISYIQTSLPSLVSVRNDFPYISFCTRYRSVALLKMKYIERRSRKDRSMFYIRGGFLASEPLKFARLEIRLVPSTGATLFAVHDYRPSLPWFLYRSTQAILHKKIIEKFSLWVNNQSLIKDSLKKESFIAKQKKLGLLQEKSKSLAYLASIKEIEKTFKKNEEH